MTDTATLVAATALAVPWIYIPALIIMRSRHSTRLDEESAEVPDYPGLVSVIVPARNEASNLEPCVLAILSNTYNNIEVVIVDDASTDGTSEIAQRLAAAHSKVRTISVDGPRPGWMGKQSACAAGAEIARGEILCFTDADTLHGPELLARSLNCIRRRSADVFSILGIQQMRSFWELAIQPQVFMVIAARFGGTEHVTNSARAVDKMANGQCLFVRRETYERLGGYSIVRANVANDIMIAQRFFERGATVVLTHGANHLSTRMYTSLEGILSGWGKNVYAGLRNAMPYGRLGRLLFAICLLLMPVFQLAPIAVIVAAIFRPVNSALLWWGYVAASGILVFWGVVYHGLRRSPLFAVIVPAGAAAAFFIFSRAIFRNNRVSWKDREYLVE